MTTVFNITPSRCLNWGHVRIGSKCLPQSLLLTPVMRHIALSLYKMASMTEEAIQRDFRKLIRINKGGNCQPHYYKFKYASIHYFIQQTSRCSHEPGFTISIRDKKMNKTWSPS